MHLDALGGKPIEFVATALENEKRTVRGGRCHRYAPRDGFPTTREDDWCGEFRKKTDGTEWMKAQYARVHTPDSELLP